MGTSSWQNIPYCIEALMKIEPRRVLDVGVGFGRWGIILREFCDVWFQRVLQEEWALHIEGIEGFEKNIAPYHASFYNRIHIGDARELIPQLPGPWDVTIYGDVLEHFEKDTAIRLLETSIEHSTYVLLNVPLGHDYPQDELYGNEFERHLSEWEAEEFNAFPLVRRALFKDFAGRLFGSFCFSERDPRNLKESLFSPHARYGLDEDLAAIEASAANGAAKPDHSILRRLEEQAFELNFIKSHSSYQLAKKLRSTPMWNAARWLRTRNAHVVTVEALGTHSSKSQGSEVWMVAASRCESERPVPWDFVDSDGSWREHPTPDAPYGRCFMSRGGRMRVPLGPDPKLTFITHPWSGHVQISFGGQTQVFDLYSPTTGALTIYPARQPMSIVEFKRSTGQAETALAVTRNGAVTTASVGKATHNGHHTGHNGSATTALLEPPTRRLNRHEEALIERLRRENARVLAVHCPRWLGITNSTRTLFEHPYAFPATAAEDPFKLDEAAVARHADVIAETGVDHIVFSGGDEIGLRLMHQLRHRKPGLTFDLLWHGSYVQFCEDYAWAILRQWIDAARAGLVRRIGTVKKGMDRFFQSQGIDSTFVLNYVPGLPEAPPVIDDGRLHVGMWISGSGYRKIPHAMLAALSMIPNARLHAAGLDRRSQEVVECFGIDSGEIHEHALPFERMQKAMRRTHVSAYVTFSECCPMLPLESLAAGVPCLTGPTSHLFEDEPYLFSRLVVPFPDRADVIADHLTRAYEEREEIVRAYAAYAPGYEARARASVQDFLAE